MNRREVLKLAGVAALWSCSQQKVEASIERGRLRAHTGAQKPDGKPGTFPLRSGQQRDGLIHVPASYRADRRMPLVILLHGAGGSAHRVVDRYRSFADEQGFIALVPDSRDTTWDVIRGDYGQDITFIDHALETLFANYAIDTRHFGIGGFSDGASYALSVGLTNGDLFTHILAFSPGFAVPADRRGRPRIYISHGTRDEILPIDSCSRRIVPRLREAGYSVRYEEFEGPHTVPAEIARQGFSWFVS